jgi:hypothetical protein
LQRSNRPRKQRVVMRPRQRVVLKGRVQQIARFSFLSGLAVFIGLIVFRNNTWAPRFVQHHTPTLEFRAPPTLANLPLLKETPPTTFALWLPGWETGLRRKWLNRYPAVESVHFEKDFLANRIVAHLEPRIPLVRWEDRGVDREGTVFTLASQSWLPLPKAVLAPATSLPALGRWLAEISRVSEVWEQVVAVSEDSRGEIWLDMGTGTRVAWGPPDVKRAQEKARGLATVLDDAHNRLSGAASADVRFFDEGRVIVKPKKAANAA